VQAAQNCAVVVGGSEFRRLDLVVVVQVVPGWCTVVADKWVAVVSNRSLRRSPCCHSRRLRSSWLLRRPCCYRRRLCPRASIVVDLCVVDLCVTSAYKHTSSSSSSSSASSAASSAPSKQHLRRPLRRPLQSSSAPSSLCPPSSASSSTSSCTFFSSRHFFH